MLYKFIFKFKKLICLFVITCIMIPLITACGEAENHLSKSNENDSIGYGSMIQGYSTYSQAKFAEMDKQMYHSYLLSGRDFILVVLPKGEKEKDKLYPDTSNYMFQAAYSGVTPYSNNLVAGTYSLLNPQYKLLMYYVVADDFLSWEYDANEEEDKGILATALDFLGPSDADNYETNWSIHNGYTKDANVIRNEEEYNLKNVVNRNSYISECDFLRVDSTNNIASYKGVDGVEKILSKCGNNGNFTPKGKNVIADVITGNSGGVTLLFSSGGMSGYFTYENVKNYQLDVPWVANIKAKHGSVASYLKNSLKDVIADVCPNDPDNASGLCKSSTLSDYIRQTEFKFKYDYALLSRLSRINYVTQLDINTSNSNVTSITSETDLEQYQKLLNGTKDVNNGTYITFTTAEGFMIDRGDIFMQSGTDLLFNTNFLEMLTQMDACTNRTLASYVAEALATYGAVVGGLAVGVGAAVLGYAAVATAVNASLVGAAYTTATGIAASVAAGTATAGSALMTVPGPGWIIGAAVLLVAGAIALAVAINTKKSIDDVNSANFCEVYGKILEEIMELENIKVPIYNYHVPHNNEYVELCYTGYVQRYNEATGETYMDCGTKDKDTGEFKESLDTPMFLLADRKTSSKLYQISGAPSLRLYVDGIVVDEIYGAASPQFVYSILDSWGVTSANNMKYYTSIEYDSNKKVTGFSIYDLLSGTERETTFSSAYYCFSTKYGESCNSSNGTRLPIRDYYSFNKGKYTTPMTSAINAKIEQIKNELTQREDGLSLTAHKEKLQKMANYINIDTGYNGSEYYAILNGKQYYINNDHNGIYLKNGSEIIRVENSEFVYDGLKFSIRGGSGQYVIECKSENIDDIFFDLKNLYINNEEASNAIGTYKTDLKKAFKEDRNKDSYGALVEDIKGRLTALSSSIPIYFSATITERDKKGNESSTTSSIAYTSVFVEIGG